MKHSFNNLLGVLEPFLPQKLVAREVWADIRKTASRLAPIYHGGLECRLSADRGRVDLHQCILQGGMEPELLLEHIQQSGWERYADWKQIAHICRQWCRPTSNLHQWISEIWLEFDIDHRSGGAPNPSIFLQLRAPESGSRLRDDLIADLLAALAPAVTPSELDSLQTALRRCEQHCPAGARLSHIGLMLARKSDRIRINMKGLSANQWPQWLRGIGWPGSVSLLSELIDPLYDKMDQLVFCVDIGRLTSPGLGLECLVRADSNRRDAWAVFLDDLIGSGMCSAEKRNGVLNWENIIKPSDDPQLWPDDLIAESLLLGPDRFSLISQKINHIKISYHPSRLPEAKAYLWFGHVWVKKKDVESSVAAWIPGRERKEADDS